MIFVWDEYGKGDYQNIMFYFEDRPAERFPIYIALAEDRKRFVLEVKEFSRIAQLSKIPMRPLTEIE